GNPIAGTEHAEGLEELVARGWTRIYRAPQGEGVERRASFTALDLSYGPELRCRCAGVGDAVEESKSDVSLRFRWERGKMFEASATGGARHTGLSPAITAGHLVTYDFATEGAFPGGKAGSCGAHLALTLLIEPPSRPRPALRRREARRWRATRACGSSSPASPARRCPSPSAPRRAESPSA